MRHLRFAAAAWLVVSTPWLLPAFSSQALRALLAQFPELTVAALAAAPLPGSLGLLSMVRWQRRRPEEAASPLAIATRWAAVLAILGLARPLGAADADLAAVELLLRGSQLLALPLLFDGPLVPAPWPDQSAGKQGRTPPRE